MMRYVVINIGKLVKHWYKLVKHWKSAKQRLQTKIVKTIKANVDNNVFAHDAECKNNQHLESDRYIPASFMEIL
jgi:hypothetical protein